MSSFLFRVRVPGSTSNLGPGFDLLGLALAIHLDVSVLSESSEHGFERLEGGASAWPQRPNLVFDAFDALTRSIGAPSRCFRFAADSEIPLARGLGSSGAAIAAGLLLACAVHERDPEELTTTLVRLGNELEGHPDNSTASLLGGCTLALPERDTVHVLRHPIHPELRFVTAWPTKTVSTAEAREVLPFSVPFADAVENPRRLAMLLEGLRTGRSDLLEVGGVDRLHVDYRVRLIPNGREALEAARSAGAPLATVSGSGSTLIAVANRDDAPAIRDAMLASLRAIDPLAQARCVEVASSPPRVERG